MQPVIINQLRDLNQEFYQSFGASFAATRGRVQPGVQDAMADIAPGASIVDLGCGHGHLATYLARQGHVGEYIGVDSSPALLLIARETSGHPAGKFVQADLQQPGWEKSLPGSRDIITAFAVLHHIAGAAPRHDIARQVHALLKPGGRFFFSCWNFLASERLRNRVQPWSVIGLEDEAVDPGDYLLDWRAGGHGYRYVHHFTESELTDLAGGSGFQVVSSSYADGAGGKLGLYQEWHPI
ncbi:MAG: class I SAM-dependent methyltransferase [Anaerolineales bacterium]|nr:class I SAM-dependent methyltransferase [Anaerolineales bacterium]